MIFLIAVVLIGVVWRRTKRFWAHGIGALVIREVTALLFSAYGTLEDPTGDGLITAMVRQATNDGLAVAALVIPVILFAWGVPIWMLLRGMKTPGPREVPAGTDIEDEGKRLPSP